MKREILPWKNYRILGRGSLSMRYIADNSGWFENHPNSQTISLPVPTVWKWLRYWFGYLFLTDRWVVHSDSVYYPINTHKDVIQ